MPLAAVFLDVGGTLLREEPARHRIYARAARKRGLAIEDGQMRELMLRAHRELPLWIDGHFRYSDEWFRRYIRFIFHGELELAAGLMTDLEEELFAAFEDPATFSLYPGLRELLADLRGHGLVLGAISNWSARLPRLLGNLGLEGDFDFVLCSALVGLEKPDPRMFELALERARCRPEQALHAGDHAEKDGAARRLGIQAVLVEHADRARPRGSGAEPVNGAGTPPSPSAEPELPRVRDLDELRVYILARSA